MGNGVDCKDPSYLPQETLRKTRAYIFNIIPSHWLRTVELADSSLEATWTVVYTNPCSVLIASGNGNKLVTVDVHK